MKLLSSLTLLSVLLHVDAAPNCQADGITTSTQIVVASVATSTATVEVDGDSQIAARDADFLQPRADVAWSDLETPSQQDQIADNDKRDACPKKAFRGGNTVTVVKTSTRTATATTTVGFNFVSYLRVSGQAFCTSFNKYSPRVVTRTSIIQAQTTTTARQTVLSASTSIVSTRTVTVVVTTVPPPVWRRGLHFFGIDGVEKRSTAGAMPTPERIRDWPQSRIASACSRVATGAVAVTKSITNTKTGTVTSTFTRKVAVPGTTTTSVGVTGTSSPGPVVQILGSPKGSPASYDPDVGGDTNITLPFEIGIFKQYSKRACMQIDGTMRTGGNCGNGMFFESNTAVLAYSDPDETHRNTIVKGKPTGIDYRIDGVAPNRNVVFRWYLLRYQTTNAFYNFTATYYENKPGVVRFDYLSMYENGLGGDVYVVAFGTSKGLRFDNTDGQLTPGKFVILDTTKGQKT